MGKITIAVFAPDRLSWMQFWKTVDFNSDFVRVEHIKDVKHGFKFSGVVEVKDFQKLAKNNNLYAYDVLKGRQKELFTKLSKSPINYHGKTLTPVCWLYDYKAEDFQVLTITDKKETKIINKKEL